jgi:hypothetical protein
VNLNHPKAFLVGLVDLLRPIQSRPYENSTYYTIWMRLKGTPYPGVICMAEQLPKPAHATHRDAALIHCIQEIIEISGFIQKMGMSIYNFHLRLPNIQA